MRIRRRSVVAGGLFALIPGVGFALDVLVYVADGTTPTGPFDEAGLRERIKSRAEAALTMVWHEGMADWAPAASVPALAALVASLPEKIPVDHAKLIVGKWNEAGAAIDLEIDVTELDRRLPATMTWTFEADGKYSKIGKAEWTIIRPQVISRPPAGGDVPQRPIYRVVDGSIKLTFKETGTFKVSSLGPDEFAVDFKGKSTMTINLDPTEKKEVDDRLIFRVAGPNALASELGNEFSRLPN